MVVFAEDFAAILAERRLMRAWRAADENVKRRGMEWYPTMRSILADAAEPGGYSLTQAVAVFSIVSPGAQLITNLRWTERALATRGAEPVGRFPVVMMRKIRAALTEERAAREVVSGPKVAAFYRAIMGDEDALVIDRWAARAAGYDAGDGRDLTARERRVIERAYRKAARKAGVSVRDFQATVWIHARETTPRRLRSGKLVIPRLADITA